MNDCRLGQKRSRDDKYYAKASFNFLLQWRAIVTREKISSLENRGIISTALTEDQKLLLRVREAASENELRMLMKEILPFHEGSRKVWEVLEDGLNGTYKRAEFEAEVEGASQDEFIPVRLRTLLAESVSRLFTKTEG